MPTKYYRKELPTQPIYVNGRPLTFDVIETSDAALIAQLDSAIAGHRGGIEEINAATYQEEVQKKTTEKRSGDESKNRRFELSAINLGAHAAAAVVNLSAGDQRIPGQPVTTSERLPSGREKPDPIMVPSPNQFGHLVNKPNKPKTAVVSPP